ncbi:hypothetical protein D3C75_1030700 [compost metagenome]
MCQTAAHKEREQDFAGQAFFRNQVQKSLQNTSIGCLVYRTDHDDRIRFGYQPICFDNGFALEFRMDQILRRQLGHIDPLHFETVPAQISLRIFDNRVNPRDQGRRSVDDNNFGHFFTSSVRYPFLALPFFQLKPFKLLIILAEYKEYCQTHKATCTRQNPEL